MVLGLEKALGPEWLSRTTGWINVPADCVCPTQAIHLHSARAPGQNEPTQAGVDGVDEMIRLVGSLRPQDLCIALISGGGSALMPSPVEGISLEDKLSVTRILMRNGATIQELNCVRGCLSRFKSGGLFRHCTAGRLEGLIISDVIGDPLNVIASGPTVDIPPDPQRAILLLQHFQSKSGERIPKSIFEAIEKLLGQSTPVSRADCQTTNTVIGNNQTAVKAASSQAKKLGYDVVFIESDQSGIASEEGRRLAKFMLRMTEEDHRTKQPCCLISGGEPTVELTKTDGPQKGGRNQEVVLAATTYLAAQSSLPEIAFLSGGTDGEDGPTDAAGAIVDQALIEEIRASQFVPEEYLAANNSYPFFEHFGALLKTGPTHTNVMDLRVGLFKAL